MFFSDIRVDYINNIMRNNVDFINFNLEQKRPVYICNVCLLGTLYTFIFCYIRVYSDIVGQIGPVYYTVNDHDMYVYVVFVYMHVTMINKYLLYYTTWFITAIENHVVFAN